MRSRAPERAGVVSLGRRYLVGASLLGVLFLSHGGARPASGAYPTLTGVAPCAGAPGKTFSVKFAGSLTGPGRRVWCEDPALVFSLPDGDSKATVSIGTEARPGIHLVRFVNSEGATAPIRFAVGHLPQVEEKVPNDELESPQVISKMPAWVQGQLDKTGDVDGYALSLKKGVPLFLRLDAYALGIPVDMHLQILDAKGALLATASDSRNLDPELVFDPPADGMYLVRVAGFGLPPGVEVGFTGGAGKPYQLTLSEGPLVTRVFPAALPAAGKHSVEARGPGVKLPGTREELSASPLPGSEDIGWVLPKGAAFPIELVRAKYPLLPPAGAAAKDAPREVKPPFVLGDELAKPGSADLYRVEMKKGEKLKARFWSKSLGLPMEGALQVTGPTGALVVASDPTADPFLEPSVAWTAPAEGAYTLQVADLFQRGGPGFEYVLEVASPVPGYTISLTDGKPLRVEVGKASSFKAKVVLIEGWKEPLVARLQGLPEGVFSSEVVVPEKGGEVEFNLQAAANAPAGSAPALVTLWSKSDPPAFVSALYPARAELRRGTSQTDFARDLWVSVVLPGTPPPPVPAKK